MCSVNVAIFAAISLLHGSECTKEGIRGFFLPEKGGTLDDSFLKLIIDLQKCFCEIIILDSYRDDMAQKSKQNNCSQNISRLPKTLVLHHCSVIQKPNV